MTVTIDCSKGVALTFEPKTREEEIVQSIFILLNTYQGEVPFYREFGIDNTFMHKPVQAAQSLYSAAVASGIEQFIPGVHVKKVTFSDNEDSPSTLRPILEVTINE